MTHKVTLLPGEGIGPEVSAATRRILEATGVQIEWEELGARAIDTDSGTVKGVVLNTAAIESVRKNKVALKGPMATAVAGGAPSVNVALRKSLELYANLRPVKNLPGVKSRFEGVDVVIVRENTEDLYSGLEHEVVPGDVMSDLAAGLVGGLGVVPSGNIGQDCAIFEAVHGTAPDIAGKGLANPTALLMSASLMLDYLGEGAAAERIGAALLKVYGEGKHVTRDVGGTAGTQEFTDAVIAALAKG